MVIAWIKNAVSTTHIYRTNSLRLGSASGWPGSRRRVGYGDSRARSSASKQQSRGIPAATSSAAARRRLWWPRPRRRPRPSKAQLKTATCAQARLSQCSWSCLAAASSHSPKPPTHRRRWHRPIRNVSSSAAWNSRAPPTPSAHSIVSHSDATLK